MEHVIARKNTFRVNPKITWFNLGWKSDDNASPLTSQEVVSYTLIGEELYWSKQ